MARHINESNWMKGSISATKGFEKGHEPQGSMMLPYQLIRTPAIR